MKPSIYNCLGIKESKNFENKVRKLIPETVKELYLMTVGMNWKSRGSYDYFVIVNIDGQQVTIRQHSHDSTAYDYYTELEHSTVKFDNWCKNVVLMLLEDKLETILEELKDEKVFN